MDDDLVASFMSVTGADSATAISYLDMCNGVLEDALSLFLDGGPVASAVSSLTAKRKHSPEENEPVASSRIVRSSSRGGTAAGTTTAAGGGGGGGVRIKTQTEVDEALANALAFEDGGVDEEGVRAPIAITQDTLIDEENYREARRGASGFRARGRQGTTTPSPAQPFRDFRAGGTRAALVKADPSGTKRAGLDTLFAPPDDLRRRGRLDEVKAFAERQGFWLLFNIQDETEFASSQLNRDTWSDSGVKGMVQSSFVLWQESVSSSDGKEFVSRYHCGGPFPLIGVVDPRTGALMSSWTGFLTAHDLIDRLVDFLGDHDMSSGMMEPNRKRQRAGSSGRSGSTAANPITVSADATEEELMAAAIAASLNSASGDDGDADNPIVVDSGGVASTTTQPASSTSTAVPLPPPPAPAPAPVLSHEPDPSHPDCVRVKFRGLDSGPVARSFLKDDSVEMLYTFVKVGVPETLGRAFSILMQEGPGKMVSLDGLRSQSIDVAGVSNSTVTVHYEA